LTFGTSVAGFASLVAEMVADGNVEESDCSIVVGRRATSRFAKTGVMIRQSLDPSSSPSSSQVILDEARRRYRVHDAIIAWRGDDVPRRRIQMRRFCRRPIADHTVGRIGDVLQPIPIPRSNRMPRKHETRNQYMDCVSCIRVFAATQLSKTG